MYIIIKSNKESVEFYVKRLSTTRNGIKGSYPIFTVSKDDAHQFSNLNVAQRSLDKLKEIETDKLVTYSIVDAGSDELVEIEKKDSSEYLISRNQTLVPINSVLSMIHPTSFHLSFSDGKFVKLTSMHQAYAYMKAFYANDEIKATEILSTTDILRISALSRSVDIDDVEDWNDSGRDNAMRIVILARYYEDSEFADTLDATGDDEIKILSKNHYWGDNYGNGLNTLGKLYEEIRDAHK